MEKGGGLCWTSGMQIYGFVENHKFLEQFVSMGYQHNFMEKFFGTKRLDKRI